MTRYAGNEPFASVFTGSMKTSVDAIEANKQTSKQKSCFILECPSFSFSNTLPPSTDSRKSACCTIVFYDFLLNRERKECIPDCCIFLPMQDSLRRETQLRIQR